MGEQPVEQEQSRKEKKVPKQGELVTAIKTVQAELAELRETLTNQQVRAKLVTWKTKLVAVEDYALSARKPIM